MKKRLATILLALCSTFAAIGFASCDILSIEPNKGKFEGVTERTVKLDAEDFNPLMVYGQNFNFGGLNLLYTQTMNGNVFYETTIGVNTSMIVSGGNTNSVGDQQMVFTYEGETWTIDYTVKYKVEFVANGKAFDTQYVLNADEIVVPDPSTQAKEGYVFAYWKTELPETLTDNLKIEAHYYDVTKAAPPLENFTLTYAPNLALKDLDLPFNACGKWEFIADENTLLGDVGTHEFDVRFIPATDELAPVADSRVSVEIQKQIVDKPVLTSEESAFTYDGTAKTVLGGDYELFTVSNNVQTNAGTYTVGLQLKDAKNYEWSAINADPVFTIARREVTFTILQESYVYDGQPHTPKYEVSEDIEITETLAPQTNAGTYSYQLLIADQNYAGGYEGELVIEKKLVTFNIVKDSFDYDGKEHYPIYEVSDPASEVKTGGRARTEAGEGYAYSLTVGNPNYTGSHRGTFEIKKPDVTITVHDKNIVYPAAIPQLTYDVVGFEDVALLNIEISKPTTNNVGRYALNATVGNPNVNVVAINAGMLTIEKGEFTDLGNPVLSTEQTAEGFAGVPAIYEDLLSTVSFVTPALGTWKWKYPDTVIDNMNEIKATAVFEPQNTNYNNVERELSITNIAKRTLRIEILKNVYTYTGEENILEYRIVDEKIDNLVYEGLTVQGNVAETEAATYNKTLQIVSDCYEGVISTRLTINKATPNVSLQVNNASVEYTPYLTVQNSGIILEDHADGAFAWVTENGATLPLYNNPIGEAKGYQVVFLPDDANNYEQVYLTFFVTVTKAKTEIVGLEDTYSYVYNGNPFVMSNLLSAKVQDKNKISSGAKVIYEHEEIVNAGTYTVTVRAEETAYYLAPETKTIKVTITQATNAWSTAPYMDHYVWSFGGKAGVPHAKATFGAFEVTYKNVATNEVTSTTPTNAGSYHAIFTVAGTENYTSLLTTKEFTITKAIVTTPTLEKNSFVYTGETRTAVVVSAQSADASLYTVAGNEAINAGVHTITLTLKDGNNYAWNNDTDTKTLVFEITQAPNAISGLTIEGWNYLKRNAQTNAPSIASASFGANTVQYSYYASRQNAIDGVNAIADISLAEVGVYYVKAYIAEEATYGNYASTSAIKEFSIVKADPEVQVSLSTDKVEWHSLLTLNNSGVKINGGDARYAWVNGNDKIFTGEKEYQIVYMPDDTKNYNQKTLTITLNVTKKVISKPTAIYTQNGQNYDVAQKYNGGEWTLGVRNAADSAYYTFEAGKGTARGHYTVELQLVYPNDTEWATGFDGTLDYEILQADNEITGFTLNGWTYGTTANTPSVIAAFGANTAVYTYADAIDGEYTTTVPTEAGNYWVKAAIAETNDYKGTELSAQPFTIAEATYTGSVTFTANYQTLTWTETLTLASANVMLGGAVGDGTLTGEFAWASSVDMNTQLHAGDNVFAVVCKIKNYLPVEGTVTIQVSADTIAKPSLAITDGATTIEGNPVYSGQAWKAAAQSDRFYEVAYTQNIVNAGQQITVTITLIDTNHVWTDGTNTALQATYTIQKASVETPQNPASVEYTGEEQTATIEETALYKEATISGTNAGAYVQALELQDPANYQWKDGKGEVIFTITQAGASKLTVTASVENNGWTYQQRVSTFSATAMVGIVAINDGEFTYQYFDSYKDPLNARPSDAGSYYVKATLKETDNYASATSEFVKFTIAQALYTPAKPTSLTATYGDVLDSVSLTTTDTMGVWTWENASTKVGDAGTQTHYAVYTYNDAQDANNFQAVARQAFTINVAKKALTVSFVENQTFTYNSNNQKENIQYEITDGEKVYNNLFVSVQVKHNEKGYTEFKNAGVYTVTITIQEDNYVGEWENTVTIGKKTPTVSVSLTDWAYGFANVPQTMTNNTDGDYTVSYVYAMTEDGEYMGITDFGALPAGNYFVKAIISETENYASATSEADAFRIEKAKVAVPTIASKPYTGAELMADVEDTADYEVITNEKGVNVGSYEVVLALKDSTNYVWANGEEESVNLTFSITKAELTITSVSVVSWTYKEIVKLPVVTIKNNVKIDANDIVYCYYDVAEGIYKEWTAAQYKVEMAKLNAGTYAMQVYVKETESGNYLASNRLNTSIFINKAKVEVPFFEDKTYAENANHEAIHQNSGLTETVDYIVFEDLGGTSKGTYEVILKLKDYTNYEWVFGAESRVGTIEYNQVTIKYTIAAAANVWTTAPDITRSWEFDKETGTVTMPEAKFGNNEGIYAVQILYTGTTNGGVKYSDTQKPTLAGDYTVTFSVAANEGEWTALSTSIDFTITKQVVDKPQIVAKDYTGDPLTAEEETSNPLYTIKQEGWIIKGEHTVTVTLNNVDDYIWEDDETLSTMVTFTINQATTEITSLTIAGWTFNEAANEPQIETNVKVAITEETYYYYDKDKNLLDENNPHKAPTLAGDYFVKAIITETSDYKYIESTFVPFTIEKADIVIPTLLVDAIYEDTLGDIFNKVAWPSTDLGDWTWDDGNETTVGNATTHTFNHNTFNATFTATNPNYNDDTATVTVIVKAKKLTINVIQNEFTYIKGEAHSVAYTVTDAEGNDYTNLVSVLNPAYETANESGYRVTLKLNESNYVANDVNTTLIINKIENNRVITLNAIYGQTLADIADQLTAFNEEDKGTWTWVTASGTLVGDVGEHTYYAKFDATDTTNYESYENVAVKVIVSAKEIDTPSFAITDGVTTTTNNPNYSGNVWKAVATSNVDYEVQVTYSKTGEAAGKDALQTISITFTLKQNNEKDIINRVWKENFDTTIVYTIQQANHTVTSLGVTGWTYGEYNQNNNTPNATVTATASNTGNKTYYYRKQGSSEWIAWEDVNAPASKAGAGTYELAVSIAETTNYNALTYYTVENDTFTIEKATVTASWKDGKNSFDYTGNPANVEVIVKAANGTALEYITDYTVPTAETNYGTNHQLTVTLTNVAYANYTFANDSQTATLTYSITTADNAWANDATPSINGWEYGVGMGTLTLPGLKFSEESTKISVTYYNSTKDKTYTSEGTTIPENMDAGNYEVTITVSGNAEGNWAEFVDESLTFTIEQQAVGADDITTLANADKNVAEYTYKGSYQLPIGLGDATMEGGVAKITKTGYVITITMNDYVTKIEDGSVEFGEDAGTYIFTLALDNSGNYKLHEDYNANGYTFIIQKAEITFGAWDEGTKDGEGNYLYHWVYGQTPDLPEIAIMRSNGGEYTVEVTRKFTNDVNKANANIYELEVNAFTATTNAGTYYAKAIVATTDNYESVETTSPQEFRIAKATPTVIMNEINGVEWMYGLKLGDLSLSGKASGVNGEIEGSYKWAEDGAATTALNATDYNDIRVIFTPKDQTNYESVTTTVNVKIETRQITVPSLTTTGTLKYGETYTIKVPTSDYYEITCAGVSASGNGLTATIATDGTITANNAGTYTVTFTLNYNNETYTNTAWNAVFDNTLTFTINKATPTVAMAPITNVEWNKDLKLSDLTPNGTATGVKNNEVVSGSYEWADGETALNATTEQFNVNFASTNDNYTDVENLKVTVTVNARQITVPSLTTTGTLKYGETYTIKVPTSDYYEITCAGVSASGNGLTATIDQNGNITATDAGTYTVTFTLNYNNETDTNTVWNADFDNTLTFTIEKARVSFGVWENTSGWTYGGNVNLPTITATLDTNGEEVTVTRAYKDSKGEDVTSFSPTSKAGQYTVVATVADTDNYTGDSTDGQYFNIAKATLTVMGGTYTSDFEYYENKQNTWWTATDDEEPYAISNETKREVPGTFTYGYDTSEYNFDGTGLQITCIFTPNDKDNYEYINGITPLVTKVCTINFKAVAYSTHIVDEVDVRTTYGTIENAVNAANEIVEKSPTTKVKVYVIPNASGDVVITEDVTVASGVTLLLPYGTPEAPIANSDIKDKPYYEATLNGTNVTIDGKTVHVRYAQSLAELMCHSRVVIASGVILTINGGLEIGGELSSGAGGRAYAGYTARNYAEIIMQSNAQIIVTEEGTGNKGELRCFGFIHEGDGTIQDGESAPYALDPATPTFAVGQLNNGSKVIVNAGGTIGMPFTLNDFRGGAYMTAVYAGSYLSALAGNFGGSQVSPFNQFELRNVTSLLRVNYGGFLIGYANLYGNGEQNATQIKLIGNTQDYLIELTNKTYSYATAKYNAHIENYTAQNGDAYCDLRIYGGADINQMQLSLSTSIKTITVQTGKLYFPLSWHYQITLEVNKELKQTSATYKAEQKFKMLPGSKLTVSKGATLNIQELSVYETFPVTGCTSVSSSGSISKFADYPDKGAALLTVNGTLNAKKLGGKVYSTEPGAILKVTTAKSLIKETQHAESNEFSDKSTYQQKDNVLSLVKYGGGNPYTAAGIYYAEQDVDGEWKWISDTEKFNITYKFCDDSGKVISTLDQIENKAASTFTYAQTLALASATYEVEGKLYIFKGWYEEENGVVNLNKRVQQIVGKDNFDKQVILWGVFEEVDDAYTVIFDQSNTPDGYELTTLESMNIATYPEALTSFNPYNLTAWAMCKYDEDYTASHYFVGWYYLNKYGEKIFINDTQHLQSNDFEDVEGQNFKTVTLHAEWAEKYHYIFDDGQNGEVFSDAKLFDNGKLHIYLMEEDIDTFSFESYVESITKYDNDISKSYFFNSWKDEDQATIISALPYEEGKKDYVISAVWEAKEYTLVVGGTYGGNGGTPTLPNTETSMLGTFYMNLDQMETAFIDLQTAATSRDSDILFSKYFANWTYEGGDPVDELVALQTQTKSYVDYFNNKDKKFTITANWRDKAVINYNVKSTGLNFWLVKWTRVTSIEIEGITCTAPEGFTGGEDEGTIYIKPINGLINISFNAHQIYTSGMDSQKQEANVSVAYAAGNEISYTKTGYQYQFEANVSDGAAIKINITPKE